MKTEIKLKLPFSALVLFLSAEHIDCVCTNQGRRFEVGDTWVDAEVCDACECNQYGVQCFARLDDGHCKLNRTVVSPGDPVCLYSMKVHMVGETFTALDGCNKCTCNIKGMNCTINSCNDEGFAKPSRTPLYGECLYEGSWYRLRSQWLSVDGCNTCYCYTVGNFRGGHVCTKNKCSVQIVDVTG